MSASDALVWSIDCNPAAAATPSSAPLYSPAKVVERSIDGSGDAATPTPQSWILRRWDAATTDRLNEAHWQGAYGEPINHDLAHDLPTLRARVAYEVSNNPNLEGVVNTHATDVVGPEGPSLQIQSDSDKYSDRLEAFFREWSEQCDIAGQLGLVDMLQLWIKGLWTSGDLLSQEVTDETSSFPAQMRLHCLHASRLDTPPQLYGDANVALGVRRNRYGRPLTYYITDPTYSGPFQMETGRSSPIPADLIYHGYLRAEPGQVRGFPLAASALPAMADLRDYDLQVLDAARAAADTGVWFTNLNPDGVKWQGESGLEIEYKRRVNRTAPPGWDVKQLQPGQPGAQYIEHRRERMAEFGRAVAMPLMLIRLDSSDHNYSSARFDQQVYVRHLQVIQSWIGRRFLNRMVKVLGRELQLAGELPAMPRGEVRLMWTWPRPPHVDPTKERAAERIGLQNRTLTFADACHQNGHSEDEVIASWIRTREKLKTAGFSPEEIAAFLGNVTAKPAAANQGPGSRQPNAARQPA